MAYEPPSLPRQDVELVRDVFWDLFRQGYITLGIDDMNANWPWFRLSYFGNRTLGTDKPYRFHNVASYIVMVQQAVPDISDAAVAYLQEAASTFYAGCMLASCVMLGVAAEAEFVRLTEEVAAGSKHLDLFAPTLKERVIRGRITRFTAALATIRGTLAPKKDFEDLDINLTQIQSVIRIARNDAGHPTAVAPPSREQVYVNLQLFIPLAAQMMRLRHALA